MEDQNEQVAQPTEHDKILTVCADALRQLPGYGVSVKTAKVNTFLRVISPNGVEHSLKFN